ncbi:hypothetical protein FRB99_007314 [Tulasnella sp. 403]|nr:hypothetical protein FRB99_007314 [Tulasnella sp. 403]
MEVSLPRDSSPAIEPHIDDIVKRERSLDDELPFPDSDALPTPVSKRRKLSEEAKSSTPVSVDTPNNGGLGGPTVAKIPVFVPPADGLPYYNTMDVPMNRQGFRYTPAGPSPPGCVLSHRTVESQPPGYVRVSWEDRSPYVRVTQDGLGILGDKGFRSVRLNVPVKEGKWYMEVKIEKGGGDRTGQDRAQGAHVRLGWGRREAPLNGPAGMDGYSYAYRDKSGEKVTLARPKAYGKPFGTGDVIGLYISLPPRRRPSEKDLSDPAWIVRKRIAINYKNQLYFESMDYAQSKEMMSLMEFKKPSAAPSKKDASMRDSQSDKTSAASRRRKSKPMPMPDAPQLRPIPTLGEESCIAFFVNGECQGPAFTDLYDFLQLKASTKKDVRTRRNLPLYLRERENHFDDGSLGYYPFLSVFNDARIAINTGPDFVFPPPPDIDAILRPKPDEPASETSLNGDSSQARKWRPLCERYNEYMAEEYAQDELDEAEAQRSLAAAERVERAGAAREDARSAKKKSGDGKKSQAKKAQAKGRKSGLGTEVINADDLSGLVVDDGAIESMSAVGGEGASEFANDMMDVQPSHHPHDVYAASGPGSSEVLAGAVDTEGDSGTPSGEQVHISGAPSQAESRATSISGGNAPPSSDNPDDQPDDEGETDDEAGAEGPEDMGTEQSEMQSELDVEIEDATFADVGGDSVLDAQVHHVEDDFAVVEQGAQLTPDASPSDIPH